MATGNSLEALFAQTHKLVMTERLPPKLCGLIDPSLTSAPNTAPRPRLRTCEGASQARVGAPQTARGLKRPRVKQLVARVLGLPP